MEEIAWKKDETPYLVFACKKCNQYTYVKTSRKTKKCVRCRHLNYIETITDTGEVVNGISLAVELVKQKQHEFAIEELGTSPEFRASDDFKIAKFGENELSINKGEGNDEYNFKFEQILHELYKLYTNFPYYMIELSAEKYGILQSEVNLLFRSFQKQGILVRSSENMYTIKMS